MNRGSTSHLKNPLSTISPQPELYGLKIVDFNLPQFLRPQPVHIVYYYTSECYVLFSCLQVHMLEDSSSAMADDLVRKTVLIEQFVKDKPSLSIFDSFSFSLDMTIDI